jgi:hypothetical protein
LTNIDANEEGRPWCLFCVKILAVNSIEPNKLKRHLETEHGECVGKTLKFFHRRLNKSVISHICDLFK